MKIEMYNHPNLYDACTKHKVDDIIFYNYWAKQTRGNILELACGTGRLAKPLMEQGFKYTGLDLSSVFINHCKNKYPMGEFIKGDMRTFQLNRQFDLIFIPFNSFLHLFKEDEMLQCLTTARNHLSKDGIFLLDIFVPDPEYLYRNPNKQYEEMIINHPIDGNCKVWKKSQFDELSEINHIQWIFDYDDRKEMDEYKFDMRMIYPDTIDRLIIESGFTINEKWGDYDGELFNESSILQLYICSNE